MHKPPVPRAGHAALDLITDAVAAYRLTKLVTDDVITKPLRDKIVQGAYVAAGQEGRVVAECGVPADEIEWSEFAMDDRHAPKLATLVTCRWCAGAYVAAGVVAASVVAPKAWKHAARVFTLSAAAALLAGLEDG